MVEQAKSKFKLKEVSWRQRKELTKALEESGSSAFGIMRTAGENGFPIDFVELAFRHGIEGYDTEESLNALTETELMEGATAVYFHVFFKPELEKKS